MLRSSKLSKVLKINQFSIKKIVWILEFIFETILTPLKKYKITRNKIKSRLLYPNFISRFRIDSKHQKHHPFSVKFKPLVILGKMSCIKIHFSTECKGLKIFTVNFTFAAFLKLTVNNRKKKKVSHESREYSEYECTTPRRLFAHRKFHSIFFSFFFFENLNKYFLTGPVKLSWYSKIARLCHMKKLITRQDEIHLKKRVVKIEPTFFKQSQNYSAQTW